MSDAHAQGLTVEEHRQAFTEVSFLLDIFASTVHDLMGGAVAPVGRAAGRQMARKLPVYLPSPSLDTALSAVAGQFRKGFEFGAERNARGVSLRFSRCAVREACASRGVRPGGDMCTLFHACFDGVVNELSCHPTKSRIADAGDTCEILMEVR